jgi:hypothetical protein
MDILKTLLSLAEFLAKAFKWVMEGDTKRKVGAIAAAILIGTAIGLSFTPQKSREIAKKAIWPWVAALLSSDKIMLSDEQARIVDRRVAMLTGRVRQELLDTLDPKMNVADKASRYTAWALAQDAMALLTTDQAANVERRVKQIEAFSRSPRRQLAGCDCWNEFIDNKSAPQHITISAWVLFTLAKLGEAPTAGELQFLRETQDGAGAWNMFNVPFGITADPGLQRPQGSSFATAWVLLALSEMQRHELITDRALNVEMDRRGRHALDYFLRDRSNRDADSQLWSLYPGWKGATDVSIGTSGLVVYALHRFMANFTSAELAPYQRELDDTDRAFLAALPVDYAQVPKPNDSDSFGYALAYEPIMSHGAGPARVRAGSKETKQTAPNSDDAAAGIRIDSVASLKLPWMIIGAQTAYPSGNYRARVRAHQFIEQAIGRIDTGLDTALQQHFWMAPELLMALRYLRDPQAVQR